MSPSKSDKNILIHGPRPSPLHINKQSHLIHKLPSSSSSSSSASVLAPAVGGGGKQQQRNHPLIIYTHSPKVIHTQARDFMALVQKLTGLYSSRNEETAQLQPTQQQQQDPVVTNYNGSKPIGTDDNNKYSYSVSPDDDNSVGGACNPYFADIPLFTPTSVDFICSPWPVYRSSPSMGSSISPSALEFIKGSPEY